MSDALDDLDRELSGYVALQHRRGHDEYTLSTALRMHRRQVLENLRDDGDPAWNIRNGLLERLADNRHIDLSGEPEVGPILEYRRRLGDDRRKGGKA